MIFLSPHDLAGWVSITLWTSAVLCAGWLWVHSRGWRVGRAMPTQWGKALWALPRRYLVDVHGKVARHRPTSWMHALLAGGFLISLTAWALYPWTSGRYWLAVQAVALVLCGAGLVLLAARRLRAGRAPAAPQRLSAGVFVWLAVAFLVYWIASASLVGSIAWTDSRAPSPYSALAAAALAAAIVYLVGFALRQPLRHALLGALYISAHPKPARFDRGSAGGLTQPETGGTVRAGVAKAADFGWKQLLSFDACIECGRCQAVCPAHASGHPLNPKALIQDLVRGTGLRREPYVGDSHGGPAVQAVGSPPLPVLGVAPETLWSCTTCAACVNACPMFIEHVDAVTDLRRHVTQELGAVPGKLPVILREIRESGNSFGLPAAHRWSWAADVMPRQLRDIHEASVLVWAGDAGFELHGQQTLRALLEMLDIAGIDHAVLGDEEEDCGHLSRRCGDEAAFARLRAGNLEILSRYRFDILLTADPHAFHTLRDEYPASPWRVLHHTEYLEQLLVEDRLRPTDAALPAGVVYHDPCYLGRYGQVYDPPRSLLERAGCAVVEPPRSRDNSFCCGAGGGQAWAGQNSQQSIAVMRLEELVATGASTIAVACPNCKSMLQSAAGGRAQVRDVAEILRASL